MRAYVYREHKRQHRWRWHQIFLSALMKGPKTKSSSLCNSNCWAFSTKGHQNKNEKFPQTMLSLILRMMNRTPSNKLSRLPLITIHCSESSLQDHTSQDHFCSVINEFSVWNSMSSNHDDETQFRILSVKPVWSFSALSFDHWWLLTVQIRAVMDGE